MFPRIKYLYLLVFMVIAIGVNKLSELLDVEHRVIASQVDAKPTDERPQDDIIIDERWKHLHWFIQISDIHISKFHDPSRFVELQQFCRINVDVIKPAVVLASGDLTDAKLPDSLGSRQYEDEWIHYRAALDNSGVLNKTKWLDIRGNHDTFNVPNIHSLNNFFSKYGVQGEDNPRSYLYTYRNGTDSVAFVAVDSCLQPGPRRPFNFVGILDEGEWKAVQALERESKKSNYSFFWGHYPTTCILSPEPGIRSVMSSGLAYMCGHFHTFAGMVPKMYTMQSTGSLELELGDWKDNRLYRIFAIDHGLFSFVDVNHHQWPVAIVTNPKNALYQMPTKEPLHRMKMSTHIRILAFSSSPIEKVMVHYSGSEWRAWHVCHHQGGPLYTLAWKPQKFLTGLHSIDVYVVDADGRHITFVHDFSLDGSRLSFKLMPKLILMGNISFLFQTFFGCALLVSIVPLCFLRWWHHVLKSRGESAPHLRLGLLRWWLRKLWILSTVDRIYYPLVLYAIYLTFGPWFIGELIDGHVGATFAWGTFIDGHFLPGSLTYAYGFSQLVTFQIPLTLSLAHCLDERFKSLRLGSSPSLCRYLQRHVPFLVILAVQMVFAYFFYLAYGTVAFLLGPLRTWALVLGILLWNQATTLPAYCLKNASMVWNLAPNQPQPEEKRNELMSL